MNIELFQPDMLENPYPTYARLRDEDPMHWHEPFGAWIMSRYDDIRQAFTDPHMSSKRAEPMEALAASPALASFFQFLKGRMDFEDGKRHEHLRGLVSRAFTPHAVESLAPRITEVVDGILDEAEKSGSMDVIADLAFPLPGYIIVDLLGVPREARVRLKQLSDEFVSFFRTVPSDASEADYLRADRAAQELSRFFLEHIESGGKSGLLRALADAELDGTRLGSVELCTNATLMLHAGYETTTNLIGNGLLALLRNPPQMEALRGDPSAMAGAIEEMLRYDSPIQFTYRVAADDFEAHGKQVKKGQLVHLLLASGNRDASQFEHPDRFDVRRDPNRHLAFGWGPHFCLGAPLARLEASIALTRLLARFPRLRLSSDRVAHAENYLLRGLKALPVTF